MISIITLTYNNYHQLKSTLEGLKNIKNCEKIIVNGGDCPLTKKFLSTYLQGRFGKDTKLIQEKDNGISDAFNKGISRATRPYITFLNSGDILLDQKFYSNACNYLEGHQDKSFVFAPIRFEEPKLGVITIHPRHQPLAQAMPCCHQSMVLRTKLFDIHGPYSDKFLLAMDYEWLCRMNFKNSMAFTINKEVVLIDGDGVSKRKELAMIKECKKALKINNLWNLKNIYYFRLRQLIYLIRRIIEKTMPVSIVRDLKKYRNKMFSQDPYRKSPL